MAKQGWIKRFEKPCFNFKEILPLIPDFKTTIWIFKTTIRVQDHTTIWIFKTTISVQDHTKLGTGTAHGQKSFAFGPADTWNKLKYDVKLASSVQSFKAKYKARIWLYSREAGFKFCFLFSWCNFVYCNRLSLFLVEVYIVEQSL